MNARKFSELYEVKFYEGDGSGLVTVRSLCNYLQAVANNHSRSRGTSIDHFEAENLTWVYSRFLLEITRYPKCFEPLTAYTWRSGFNTFFAYREFVIAGGDGLTAAAGTTVLALIDRDTRKPVPIPNSLTGQFAPELGSAIIRREERLSDPAGVDTGKEFPVRTSDIDINGHVNNAAYIEWITECVPEATARIMRPCSIEVDFLAEAFYGETIRSESGNEDGGADESYLHRLVRTGDGRVTTRGRTRWKAF